MDLFNQTTNSAIFSENRIHRFVLIRIWDPTKPKICFIGLNPSTANENTDDPTIRRVIRFASDWGYGGVYMLNLFTYVTAYPNELEIATHDFSLENEILFHYASMCDKVVFAWGNFKQATERANQVKNMFDGYCLGVNKNGSPKHPLYVPAAAKLVKYKHLAPASAGGHKVTFQLTGDYSDQFYKILKSMALKTPIILYDGDEHKPGGVTYSNGNETILMKPVTQKFPPDLSTLVIDICKASKPSDTKE